MGIYDTIGGTPRSPAEDETPCEVCGRFADGCICQECPFCGAAGDPRCYVGTRGAKHRGGDHGMLLRPTHDAYERTRIGVRLMTTSRDAGGVYYAVYNGAEARAEELIWHRYVRFGKSKPYRLGGTAFRSASQEQERVAKEGP